MTPSQETSLYDPLDFRDHWPHIQFAMAFQHLPSIDRKAVGTNGHPPVSAAKTDLAPARSMAYPSSRQTDRRLEETQESSLIWPARPDRTAISHHLARRNFLLRSVANRQGRKLGSRSRFRAISFSPETIDRVTTTQRSCKNQLMSNFIRLVDPPSNMRKRESQRGEEIAA